MSSFVFKPVCVSFKIYTISCVSNWTRYLMHNSKITSILSAVKLFYLEYASRYGTQPSEQNGSLCCTLWNLLTIVVSTFRFWNLKFYKTVHISKRKYLMLICLSCCTLVDCMPLFGYSRLGILAIVGTASWFWSPALNFMKRSPLHVSIASCFSNSTF